MVWSGLVMVRVRAMVMMVVVMVMAMVTVAVMIMARYGVLRCSAMSYIVERRGSDV